MMIITRLIFLCFLGLASVASHAQILHKKAAAPVVDKKFVQLANVLERTKKIVETKSSANPKAMANRPAQVIPEINRYLVASVEDFTRIAKGTPTQEAYMAAIDQGLTQLAPLAATTRLRLQIATYYLDLMDIVGLTTSEGRLDTFVQDAPVKEAPAAKRSLFKRAPASTVPAPASAK